jgi:streptothricin hydrolase
MPHTVDAVDALVIVDAQKAFLSGDGAVPAKDDLVRSLGDLLRRAREAGALVVHLQNDGPPGAVDEPDQLGWELYFSPAASDREVVIRKTKDDGFDGTSLAEHLGRHEVRRIAVGGVMSEMCVAATARTALARGLGVVLPHDAHATYNIGAAPGISDEVPAAIASRVAEWSLGDEIEVVARTTDVEFGSAGPRGNSG